MYKKIMTFSCALFLGLFIGTSNAQDASQEKKYSLTLGIGYYTPLLTDNGVSFPDAQYAPEIGVGFSFLTSFDYAVTDDLYLGLGFNGNYGTAKFIKNATINDQFIDGYLKAGALENLHILLNVTYAPQAEGIQPFGKFGLGYFIEEVELGDVPLELTNNVELEIFPDYKSSGLGILPEVGAKYNDFTLSIGYGLPFDKLTGEDVPGGYISTGTVTSHGLQVNASYRILLF